MKTPALATSGEWTSAFGQLELGLPEFLRRQRWFGGKARQIRKIGIEDAIPIPHGSDETYVTLARVEYMEGVAETYAIPLTFVSNGDERAANSNSALATVATGTKIGVI